MKNILRRVPRIWRFRFEIVIESRLHVFRLAMLASYPVVSLHLPLSYAHPSAVLFPRPGALSMEVADQSDDQS